MFKKMPLISVIVPVYNVGEFLLPCLDSLKAQTYENLEILLIDDGSTDGSGEACDAYAGKDNRFKAIHKENGGVSSARNLGLDMAQGEYIAFIDADDWILPDYFEVLYQDLTEQGADAAFCNYILVDDRNQEIPLPSVRFPKKERLHCLADILLSERNFRSVCCCLFVAPRLQNYRFSSLRHGEDALFMFYWLCSNPVISTNPYRGYFYVQHPTSATHKKTIPDIIKWKDYLTLDAQTFLNLPITTPELQKYYTVKYARPIHTVAYLSALPENSLWKQENLMEHVNHILPYAKLLPKKLRFSLSLYKNAPWLFNFLVRIKNL